MRRLLFCLPLLLAGCSSPQQCELSDVRGDMTPDELVVRVHYHFNELPNPNDVITFTFAFNGGKAGLAKVTKRGREINEDGEVEARTSARFFKRSALSAAVSVNRGPAVIADPLEVDF